MNEKTMKALFEETADENLAWDSYRRFLEHYLLVVHMA
jgi:hypothetical protein